MGYLWSINLRFLLPETKGQSLQLADEEDIYPTDLSWFIDCIHDSTNCEWQISRGYHYIALWKRNAGLLPDDHHMTTLLSSTVVISHFSTLPHCVTAALQRKCIILGYGHVMAHCNQVYLQGYVITWPRIEVFHSFIQYSKDLTSKPALAESW